MNKEYLIKYEPVKSHPVKIVFTFILFCLGILLTSKVVPFFDLFQDGTISVYVFAMFVLGTCVIIALTGLCLIEFITDMNHMGKRERGEPIIDKANVTGRLISVEEVQYPKVPKQKYKPIKYKKIWENK